MTWLEWTAEHWFTFLQSAGIVGSLWAAERALRLDAKTRQITLLFEIIAHHRAIWSQLYERPELSRIRESQVDLEQDPITPQEELFVTQVIFQIGAVLSAVDAGVAIPFEGQNDDVRSFFSQPIPRVIWRRRRGLQNRQLRSYIDKLLAQV